MGQIGLTAHLWAHVVKAAAVSANTPFRRWRAGLLVGHDRAKVLAGRTLDEFRTHGTHSSSRDNALRLRTQENPRDWQICRRGPHWLSESHPTGRSAARASQRARISERCLTEIECLQDPPMDLAETNPPAAADHRRPASSETSRRPRRSRGGSQRSPPATPVWARRSSRLAAS